MDDLTTDRAHRFGVAGALAASDETVTVRRPVAVTLKRGIDIVGALVGLVVLSPLFIAVGLLVLVTDGRPILFRQERVGRHGRAFTLVKFRTMVPDAEAETAVTRSATGKGIPVERQPRRIEVLREQCPLTDEQ